MPMGSVFVFSPPLALVGRERSRKTKDKSCWLGCNWNKSEQITNGLCENYNTVESVYSGNCLRDRMC